MYWSGLIWSGLVWSGLVWSGNKWTVKNAYFDEYLKFLYSFTALLTGKLGAQRVVFASTATC
jgi:hypothetical protein